MGINWRRWLLSGIVAGVVINVSGILLAHFVLGPEYTERFFDKLGHQPTPADMFLHLGMRTGFGLLAMFIYVGMRPRFGPGPKTAVVAGLVVYAGTYLVLTKALVDFDILVGWWTWACLAWGLAEIVLATLAGAFVYREAAPDAGKTAGKIRGGGP